MDRLIRTGNPNKPYIKPVAVEGRIEGIELDTIDGKIVLDENSGGNFAIDFLDYESYAKWLTYLINNNKVLMIKILKEV